MARKPPQAASVTPLKAIEPKRDRLVNPLLTEPVIHPDLKPLFDAMVMVVVWSEAIARCCSELSAERDTHGMPSPDDWPDSPALERIRARHAECVMAAREEYDRNGESVAVGDFVEPRWTELMRQWSAYYQDWCAAIATAKILAKSPAVAAIMDAGESRPAHRWTMQAIIDLDGLASTLHPINLGGDGLGLIRCGLPPLPTDFLAKAEAMRKRIAELRSMPTVSGNEGPVRCLRSRVERVIALSRELTDYDRWNDRSTQQEIAILPGNANLYRKPTRPPPWDEWTQAIIGAKAALSQATPYIDNEGFAPAPPRTLIHAPGMVQIGNRFRVGPQQPSVRVGDALDCLRPDCGFLSRVWEHGVNELEEMTRALKLVEAGADFRAATDAKAREVSKPEASPTKLPKTRRGLQRLVETSTRDQPIIAAIKEGKSYRQVARECKVGKTTVERVAKAYGLTGHAPETVPREGTLQENLSVRGKPGKHRSK